MVAFIKIHALVSMTKPSEGRAKCLFVVIILELSIIIIIIITCLLTYLLTAIEFLLSGSSSYTSTDKTNKNKYT